MKLKDSLAAQYWIDNTDRLHEERDFHISGHVMDAYRAGFEKARELAEKLHSTNRVNDCFTDSEDFFKLGEEDVDSQS